MYKSEGLLAIDNGGHSTCVMTADEIRKFPSAKGVYHERSLVNDQGVYDFIIQLNNSKYFAGTLARESYLPLQMHTSTKQHLFYDLSILTAVHQFGYDSNYLSVSVPIKMHTKEEKEGIRSRLMNDWVFTVNGVTKHFTIENVIVCPESAVSYWNDDLYGLVRYVDFGSRTINFASVESDGENMRFIDNESGTFFGRGLEAMEGLPNLESLSDFVAGRLLSKWSQSDNVILIGGGALNQNIVERFTSYFPNTIVHEDPQLATVKGMYALGRSVFDYVKN